MNEGRLHGWRNIPMTLIGPGVGGGLDILSFGFLIDFINSLKGCAQTQDCAPGSRIFHPLIRSQSMKTSSPKNVIKRNPRWAFG